MTDRERVATSARRREPPPEAIQCGYYLMKAREYILKEKVIPNKDGNKYTVMEYLWWAHQRAVAAGPILAEEADMYYMQTEAGQTLICEAMAGVHKIGEAHDNFRKLMDSLGYRPITNRDFATYGSGGGR